MLLDLDMPNLRKNDLAIVDDNGRFPFELFDLGIAKAIVTVIPLEAWEAGGFTILASPKEGFECFVHPLEGILQDLRVDLVKLRTVLFDFWKLSRLHLIGDTDMAHTPGFTPLFQSSIID